MKKLFSAMVMLAGSALEPWKLPARAVKRDVEIGVTSDVAQVIIKGRHELAGGAN